MPAPILNTIQVCLKRQRGDTVVIVSLYLLLNTILLLGEANWNYLHQIFLSFKKLFTSYFPF